MKKLIILIGLALCYSTQAQKIKFKDVLVLINSGQKDEAYSKIKILLKSDSTLPYANFYAAMLLYEKSKKFDVLKNNEAALIICSSTQLYLKAAKNLINKKEIRKNEEYYIPYKNTPKITENSDTILKRVLSDIDFFQNDIAIYQSNITKIFAHFNRSIVNYTKASQLFYTINSNYSTAKEMCLLSDEKLISDLNTIILSYDSTIYHLKAYTKAIKVFPINDYHQAFEIQPIETFKIDGLTNADFLASNIPLWNYGEWAKSYKSIIENEIKKIRTLTSFFDNRYNDLFDKLSMSSISYDSIAVIKPDKKLYNLINKFDYNSLIIKIMNYKQCKLQFLGNKIQKVYSLDNTNTGNIEAKSGFVHSLSKQISQCDTLLNKIINTNLSLGYKKNKEYITKIYGDTVGLKSFYEKEKVFLQEQKNNNYLFYQTMMYSQMQKYFDTTLYVSYGNYLLPIFKKISLKNTIQTTAIKENSKQDIFITGNMPSGEVFLCKINPSKKVEWLKTIPKKVPNSKEYSTALTITDDACIMVINSISEGIVKNTLVKFDKTGVENFSKSLNANAIARYMIYDEINDAYLIVFKGNTLSDFSNKIEEVAITNFDGMGNNKNYLRMQLHGNIAELSKMSDGYLILLNYASLQINGTKLESEAGNTVDNTNICMLKLNPQIEFKSIETIPSKTPIYSVGSVKISNSVINILGYNLTLTPDYNQQLPSSYTKRLHKVINSNLEFIE